MTKTRPSSFSERPITNPAKFAPILLSGRSDDGVVVCLVGKKHTDFTDDAVPLQSEEQRRDRSDTTLRSPLQLRTSPPLRAEHAQSHL